MNYLKRAIFGGGGGEQAQAQEPEQEQTRDQQPGNAAVSEEDVLNLYMPEEMQEEMFCFTMGDCEMHQLVSRHDRQFKECEFMHASVHITAM